MVKYNQQQEDTYLKGDLVCYTKFLVGTIILIILHILTDFYHVRISNILMQRKANRYREVLRCLILYSNLGYYLCR